MNQVISGKTSEDKLQFTSNSVPKKNSQPFQNNLFDRGSLLPDFQTLPHLLDVVVAKDTIFADDSLRDVQVAKLDASDILAKSSLNDKTTIEEESKKATNGKLPRDIEERKVDKKSIATENLVTLPLNKKLPQADNYNLKEKMYFVSPNRTMMEIRRILLRLEKQTNITYLNYKQKMMFIFKCLHLLSQQNKHLTNKNQLSATFLKVFFLIFRIPTLDEEKRHELFKISLNCYVFNFKNFTRADKFQFNLLFGMIFDVIIVNNKKKGSNGQSYIGYIHRHKVKTKLTIIDNKAEVQVLLYYLLQLLFLVVESQDGQFTFSKFYFVAKFQKMLAFLIFNSNIELLRMFHKYRKAFYLIINSNEIHNNNNVKNYGKKELTHEGKKESHNYTSEAQEGPSYLNFASSLTGSK